MALFVFQVLLGGFTAHYTVEGQAFYGIEVSKWFPGAGLQCIQREHAPGAALDVQAQAHAVVHRQRLAHLAVHQAIVGVGQGAVVVEAGDLAPGQDGGQARVLEFSEVKAEWFRPIYDFHSFKVLPRLGQLFAGDAASYQYLAESIRKHPPQEQLKAMMEEAGLSRCGYVNLSAGIVAVHTGYKV